MLLKNWLYFVFPIFFILSPSVFPVPQGIGGNHDVSRVSPYSIKIWNTENGLPQNTVNKVTQTRDHYLWIATNDGLLRYDGIKFTLFNLSNTPQLRSNRIVDLHEDKFGALWISTENCKITVYRDHQFFQVDEKSLFSGFISMFAEDGDGNVWVCTNDVVARFTNYQVTASQSIHLQADNFRRVTYWEDGALYIGGTNFYQYRNGILSEVPGFHNVLVQTICKSPRGGIVLGTLRGIYRLHKGKFTLEIPNAGTGPNILFSVLEEQSGKIWLASKASFLTIFENGKQTRIPDDIVSHDYIQNLICDHEGNIWAGTYSSGLLFFKKRNFTAYNTSDGLTNNYIYPLLQGSDGAIYIGTNGGGLNKLENGKVSQIAHDPGVQTWDDIWALCEDADKNIWVGTYGNGVTKISGTTFTRFAGGEWYPARVTFAIIQDHKKNMWFGTMNGLLKYDGKKTTYYTTKDGLPHNDIKCLFEDSDGSIWIGTSGGISHFDGKRFANYSTKNGLSSDFVRVITKDSDGNYWFGTYGGGLNRLRNGSITHIKREHGLYDDNVSAIIEDNLGFFWMTCNRGIYRVNVAELNKFADGKTKTIHCASYDKSDGLLSNECNGGCQPSACKSKDGKLYFPTLNGMVCVDPAKLPAAKTIGPTFIENILVDERPVPFTDSLIVGPDYDRIEIHYTAINFSNPNNVRFKYFVKELFTNWTAPSANRFAVLMNLSPGTYHFNVVNCSDDGLWNETPTTLTIIIRAHFYQTAWFYAALFLLIPFGVALAALLRIRFLERQTKHLNTLVEEKTKDLSDEKQNSENAYIEMRKAKETAEQEKEKAEQANFQKSELMNIMMHDLKNPIISINGGATLITENPEDTDMVKHMGSIIANSSARMTELVTKLHEHNKLEEFYVRMDIHPVDILELLKTVIKKNELQAAKKQQHIVLTAEVKDKLTVNADAEKLYSALDNLINNAVKYSPLGKTVHVSVSATKDLLRLSIRDEGPGLTEEDLRFVFGKFQRLSARPTADETSTGLGLSIVKQIVELHKGVVWVESKNHEGAEFIIELPL